MKNKMLLAGLALALGAGISFQASAQVKPETLVKQRQAVMTLHGKYIGPIGAMVQGKMPYDAAVVARNAAYLEVLSKMPWDGFHASTADVKSDTLPEAFKDTDKFQKASEALETAAAKLSAAAKSGDQGAVKTAFGDVGKTCKGCHDDFRPKK